MHRLNQSLVGLVVLLTLVGATVFSLTAANGLFQGGYALTADFTDAAGLAAGDSVLVAGVRVGSVDRVDIDGEHAKAWMTVDTELPDGTRAEIILRNFLGKRAVVLATDGDWSQPLEGGDHIPVERTSTPVDFQGLKDAVTEVVHEQDVDAVSQLVSVLADATEGTAEDVGRLLDGLDRLTQVISNQRDELAGVISNTNVVVDVLATQDADIVTIVDEFGSTLDRLARRRTDLQRLLSETAAATTTAADLIGDERAQLDRVLDELTQDLAIVDQHQVDLAHALAYGGVSFWGFANTFMEGGQPTPWQNINVTSQGPVGIDALVGCGGTLDRLLDEVLGPDPRSCQEQAQTTGGAEAASTARTRTQPSWPEASLRSLFTWARHAGGHR